MLHVCRLRDGIYNVLGISSLGNQYIQANKPWDLLKGSNEDRSVSADICLLFILSNIFVPMHCHLYGIMPPYLTKTLQLTSDISIRRHIRSAVTTTLVVLLTRRSALGNRAFPVAAARSWNTLPSSPSSLRTVPSLTSFRCCLKTELFNVTLPSFFFL